MFAKLILNVGNVNLKTRKAITLYCGTPSVHSGGQLSLLHNYLLTNECLLTIGDDLLDINQYGCKMNNAR